MKNLASRLLTIAVFVFLGSLSALASAPREMTIVSWNIRTGRGLDDVRDLRRVASVIKASGADIVALEEVDRGTRRSNGVDQLAELAKMTGMIPSWGKAIDFSGGEYGVALLSRTAPLRVRTVPLTHPKETESRVLLIAEFEDFVVGVTHLSLHDNIQLANVAAIRAALSLEKPCFLAGDWNATPESATLKAVGETFEILSGDAPTYPANEPKTCIDYVAVTRRHRALFGDVTHDVLKEPVASDHRPVRVRLHTQTPNARK